MYTDGACRGNPGPGGWGAYLEYGNASKKLNGYAANTTNNRMELTAVISALAAVKNPSKIKVVSDSQYVTKGMSEWIDNWMAKEWKTSNKKAVKNVELWQALDKAVQRHKVKWHWLRGHTGHAENERADDLARTGMAPYKVL